MIFVECQSKPSSTIALYADPGRVVINEMRRPWEFVKSFTTAEFLVLIVYLVYGAYGYGLQGQYVLPVAFQGVSKYVWQSIGNG